MKLGVLISGRGSNLKALLDARAAGQLAGAEFVVVFSNKPDAPGLDYARDAGIPVESLPSKDFKGRREDFDEEVVGILNRYGCEALVLAGYMRIMTAKLIHAFPQGIINIHPSLLPAFPGINAQQQAVDYGAKVSGCTVHFVDEGMDTGPIILQQPLAIKPGETGDEFAGRLIAEEHQLLVSGVELLTSGRLRRNGRIVTITEESET